MPVPQSGEVSAAATDKEAVEIKTESTVSRKENIRKLREEIEQIKLADSKVANGQYWGISKESIADDVHMAGQSVAEREAAIRSLKQQGAAQKKHWWQKAAVVGGMFLSGLLGAKDKGRQPTDQPTVAAATVKTAKQVRG